MPTSSPSYQVDQVTFDAHSVPSETGPTSTHFVLQRANAWIQIMPQASEPVPPRRIAPQLSQPTQRVRREATAETLTAFLPGRLLLIATDLNK